MRKSEAGSWTRNKSPKNPPAALSLALACGLFAACGQPATADTRVLSEVARATSANDASAAHAFTCESQNPEQPEIITLILRPEKGWLASLSECPAGSDAPCGGVQVATAPKNEDGYMNHYQKGFDRLMFQIALAPDAEGAFHGKRPNRDNDYICAAEF